MRVFIAQPESTRCQLSPSHKAAANPHKHRGSKPRSQSKSAKTPKKNVTSQAATKRQWTMQHSDRGSWHPRRGKCQAPVKRRKLWGGWPMPNPPKRQIPNHQVPARKHTHTGPPHRRPTDLTNRRTRHLIQTSFVLRQYLARRTQKTGNNHNTPFVFTPPNIVPSLASHLDIYPNICPAPQPPPASSPSSAQPPLPLRKPCGAHIHLFCRTCGHCPAPNRGATTARPFRASMASLLSVSTTTLHLAGSSP